MYKGSLSKNSLEEFLRLGKTLKLENYPKVTVIESTYKTFSVPKDRSDAQFYIIFRSHFVNTVRVSQSI